MLIIMLILYSFSTIAAEYTLTLRFQKVEDKEQWVGWFLDQGGEDSSGFFVRDWNNENFVMIKDKSYKWEMVGKLERSKRK